MGPLSLSEIGKIMSRIDPRVLGDMQETLERGKRLQDILFAYVDAHDERKRIGTALRSGDEEGLHRFDLAVEREEDVLVQLRQIIREVRAQPPILT